MSLKIIYLYSNATLQSSSVQNKVISQIMSLNASGANCRGAFFTTEVDEKIPVNEFITYIPVKKCSWKYFTSSGRIRKTMQSVLDYSEKHYNMVDYFILRYPEGGSLQLKFTRKFGQKIIFEHLSIEEFEIQLQAKENLFGLRPSKLFSWLEYSALPLWRECLYGKSIRKNARMGVCNSKEIADYQKRKSGGVYNCVIGGDAVNVSAFPLQNRPKFTNELRMVFLKGASTRADFNGLDRIIKSIAGYSGECKIILYILGHQLNAEKELIKTINIDQNIKLLPPKSGSDLFEFLKDIHIGVATLGLFRKELNETTTIKVREYTALGLPFIYAYNDTDLYEDAKLFSLKFPNNDSLIDLHKVIDFAKKALSNENLSYKMRHYAEKHLDYNVKMKKLYKNLLELQK